jgi:hypothetical protein
MNQPLYFYVSGDMSENYQDYGLVAVAVSARTGGGWH